MSAYNPPLENLIIFDTSVFRATNPTSGSGGGGSPPLYPNLQQVVTVGNSTGNINIDVGTGSLFASNLVSNSLQGILGNPDISVDSNLKLVTGRSLTIAAGTTTNLYMDRDIVELYDPTNNHTGIVAGAMSIENGTTATQISPAIIQLNDPTTTTTLTGADITSGAFIKTGGTSTQYLMADGSVTTNSGTNAGSNIYLYNNNNTNYAPPIPAGDIKYNNAVQDSATIVYISHLTRDNVDIDVFLAQINTTSILYLQDQNNSTNFIYYDVTGATTIIPNNYISVPVVKTSSGGTGATTFGSGHNIILSILTNQTEINNRLTTLEVKTQNQSAVSNATTFVGSIIKSGGTSSQFLKADGSVDATTYVNRNEPTGVAIGVNSVAGTNSVSVGIQNAAQTGQGAKSVALGWSTGGSSQGANSVAIGNSSGNTSQGAQAIAIGNLSATLTQGAYGIAIGSQAGQSSQGAYAVAIGYQTGATNQPSQSLILNATNTSLNCSSTGLFISPVRAYSSQTQAGALRYDTGTKEVYYGSPIEHTIVFNGGSISTLNATTAYYFGGINEVAPSTTNNVSRVNLISPYTGVINQVNLQTFQGTAGTADSVSFSIKNNTTNVTSLITSVYNFSSVSNNTAFTLATPLVVSKNDNLSMTFTPSVAQTGLSLRLQATAIVLSN